MQKKHLIAGSAIGGFLLATSSLTSVASAQTLLIQTDGDATFAAGGAFSAERFTISGASGLTVGPFDIAYNLGGGASGNGTTLRLEVSTNIGSFNTGLTTNAASNAAVEAAPTVAGSNANVVSALGSLIASLASATVSTFGGQVTLTTVLGTTGVNALRVTGLSLIQVQSLATAGTALTLTGSTFTGNNTTASNTDSVTIGTSAASHTMSASVSSALTADAEATPPFSAFDGGGSTALLATLNVVGDTAQNASIDGQEAVENLVSSTGGLNIQVTTDVLGQTGITGASVVLADATPDTSTASISSGAIASNTFSVSSVEDADGGFGAGTTSIQINAIFDGTTAIETADAGTIAATLVGTATSALVTFSGTTAPIVRNGISTEVNFFQGAGDSFGTTTFQSFLRISNSGTVAGTATISAVDSDGASIGTAYTTAEIPVNGQIQLSNSDIETGLGITDGQSGQYTVFITGPFQGYVQHVMLNNTTSAFTNLSGFRGNTGGTNGNIIP